MTTHTLNEKGYPSSWPLPSHNTRHNSVIRRITDEQKKALYERETTTRELAHLLKVDESYLSSLFPGKGPTLTNAKRELLAIRKEYRLTYADRVLKGAITIKAAAEASRVPYRTMARAVQALKKSNYYDSRIQY